MLDLLIRGGTIVDGQGSAAGSVGILGSRIAAHYAPDADLPTAKETIDASHMLVLPGLIDPHVHFYGEGIGEYSRLAVMGGVTTFIGMIRGAPEEPLAEVVERQHREGAAKALTDFAFHVVLYDREESVAQIAALAARGFQSYKMFLAYKRRGMMVRESFLLAAMDEIRRVGGIALVHAEDGEVIDWLERRAEEETRRTPADYEPTRPAEVEASAINVVALCAQATGCPAYIVHLSSAAGLAAIERARHRGVPLWVETCPQYLLFDDGTLRRHGSLAKIAPPLRGAADQRALSTALLTGAVNTIGSDHASHTIAAKAAGKDDIFAAPFGMPGSPTLWPSMYSWAVENGIPLPILVRAMSATPARLFGLAHRKGGLRPGMDADIILIDPTAKRVVDGARLSPGVAPGPLEGVSLAGWPEITISRGEVVWRAGRLVADAGRAQLIQQKRC
ncbi:MAG TPA: amidohydrolase family protein [Alphaproteobacteria bacterium]|nr:amidohydrolase family protein [Alphaproteobacteria bacterium]